MAFRTPSMRLVAAIGCLVALSAVAGVGTADSHVGVEDGPGNETLGDVVEFTVSVPENGTATVVFEATGADAYRRTVRLNDTSGDGTVTLRVNTFRGKRGDDDSAVYSVRDDEVAVRGNFGSDMDPQEYDIRLYNGTNTSGAPTTTTAVNLAAPTDADIDYSVAPAGSADRLDSREAIEQARSEGWLTDTEEAVAAGDTLVLSLRVDGLEGALAAAESETWWRNRDDSERFLSMLDREETALTLEWDDTTMTAPEQRQLNRTTIAAVVPDIRNDTYHVVLNTTDAGIVPATGERVDDGDEFTPLFVVAGESRLAEDSYAPRFDIEEPEAELVWPPRQSLDGATVTVGGRTNIAPGTRVRVRLTGNGTNFTTASRTVRPGGLNFNVTVATDALVGADTTRVLRNRAAVETDTRQIQLSVPSDQSIADGRLQVPSVWLPSDGYLHVVGPDGTVVGRSDELGGERYHNVTVPLSITEVGPDESLVVVPAYDEDIDPVDINYYQAFFVDGPPPGVTVNITTVNETAVQTETPTASASPATATATAADGPGFGVLAAILAVALFALAARCR